MIPANNPTAHELLDACLLAYDEALAGRAPPDLADNLVPAEVLPELGEYQSCLRLLEELWPRGRRQAAGAAPATPQPDLSRPDLATSADGAGCPPGRSSDQAPPELADHPRYLVEELLGAGGMGAVYRARHRLMERAVAVKVMRPELLAHAHAVERFRQEVRTAAALDHPNIVRAYDAEQAGGLHLLVMEYVEGASLDRVLKRAGPLPVAEACDAVRQAAGGLQYAHEQGLVHRDLKPANLMRTPRGLVKILDFGLAGIAREGESGGRLTRTGAVLGTPDYMAPEQANDAGAADVRADIYSLGCTLYELLTGRPPYPGGKAIDKIVGHFTALARPLAELRPGLPAGLAEVVGRMMAKEPADRYQTPAEVARALEPFIQGSSAQANEPQPETRAAPDRAATPEVEPGTASYATQPARARRRRLLVTSAGLCLSLAAAAVVIIIIIIRHPDGSQSKVVVAPGFDVRVDRDKVTITPQEKKAPRPAEGPPPEPPPPQHLVLLLHFTGPACACFSADGKRIFAGHREGRADTPGGRIVAEEHVYSAETALKLGESGKPLEIIYAVAASPDGKWFASGGGASHKSGQLRLLAADFGRAFTLSPAHAGEVSSVCFSADSKLLASGGRERNVRVWDVGTRKVVREIGPLGYAVAGLAFHPTDARLAIVSDRDPLRIWDLAADKPVSLRGAEARRQGGVAFSPDGTHLATACTDGSVLLWESATGKLLATVGSRDVPQHHVRFSGNGRYLFTTDHVAGQPSSLQIWDVRKRSQKISFPAHDGLVTSLDLSADGKRLLTACEDGEAKVWEVPAWAWGF
jgi:WD40 repeat protein/tRNA A-37 threonylcarbamoyl transferase component Bud32